MRIEITLLQNKLFQNQLNRFLRLKANLILLIGAMLFVGNLSAQIAQRGTSTTQTSNGGTVVINKPTGVVTNDLMIAVVAQSDANSAVLTNATRSGWTAISGGVFGTSGTDRWHLTVLYRIADATDSGATNYSFALTAAADDGAGSITAFSGVDTSNPFDVAAVTNSGTSNTITSAGLTSLTNNAVIMMIAGIADNVAIGPWSTTSPGTLNEVFEIQDNATADQGLAGAIGTKTTAGPTGSGTASLGSSLQWTTTMIALRPVTISTGTISSPLCAGAAVSVPYTISGPYASNNTFTAQLSDASGSFASPTAIGSVANTNTSGSISATIPAGQAAGSGYRIRVVSSAPAAVGTPNAADIAIQVSPTANAGSNLSTCETSGAVNITAGATASGQTSVLWTSSGTGTFTDADSLTLASYTPSAADITAGSVTLTLTASGNCTPATSNKILTILKLPVASAGGSATICSNQTAVVSGASSANGNISWTENGAGSITAGVNTLTPTYTPAAGDIGNLVTLTMTVSNASCPSAQATYTVNVVAQATAIAGTAVTTCSNSGAVNITAGSSASNNTGVTWTSSGTGSFTNANSLTDAEYTPSAADITAGSVTLTLTATGNSPCGNATSNKTLTINAQAVANAGPDLSMCSSTANIALSGSRSGFGVTSSTWTTSGTGTFSSAASLTPTYTPSAADKTAGTVTLTLTTNDPAGPCGQAVDTMILTIFPAATAVAGANQTVCAGGTINISGSINGGATSATWSAPSGTFGDVNSLSTTYTPSVASGNVILTLTTNDPTGPCNAVTSTLTVTVNALPTLSAVSQAAVVCENTNAQINLNGLLPNSTSSITYTINNGAPVTINGINANPGGNANFPLNVALVNNGQQLKITSIERTDLAVDCNRSITTNNTVTLQVNANVTYYQDLDADGFGNVAATSVSCFGTPVGYVANSTDCDDNDNTKHAMYPFYFDNDGDTFAGTQTMVCAVDANTPPSPAYTTTIDDCDDEDNTKHNTYPFYADNDGDTYGAGSTVNVCAVDANTPPSAAYVLNNTDCDDTDNTKHTTYPFYVDGDGDGFGAGSPVQVCAVDANTPPGAPYVLDNTDCDDNDNTKHTTFVFYADTDNDGYGEAPVSLCAVDANTPPIPGYVTNDDDCDDTNANIHPGATEIGYNLVDDDCDGSIDEGFPPKVTQLHGAFCNATVASIDTQIMANIVAGAQGYRWRVTTLTGPNAGQVQFLDTAMRVMKFTQLANYAFDTQYQIAVAVYYAGYLQPYTNTCNVTTPVVTTQLSNCNATMSLITDPIYANLVPFASGYRFRITDPLNPLNTQSIDRPIRDVRMAMVTAFPIQYGKTYNVEVAVKNTDGTYMPFGNTCQVSTPVFPTTSLQDSQCEDYAVASNDTPLYAISHPGAIRYVFKFTGPGLPPQGVEVVRVTRMITLASVPGMIPGQIYNVNVRLVFNLSDPAGPYGKTCTVVAPGTARQTVKAETAFDAVAYPNPSVDSFNIKLTSELADDVTVKVYDMTGRLLENVKYKAGESIVVGQDYPSGVYNIIVSQGDNTDSLRVIKR